MKDVKAFFKGFFYAGRGIVSTIYNERNMRMHLIFLIYMFSILLCTDWFKIKKSGWVALVIASILVIAAELFNTAVEHAVDLASNGQWSEHGKLAKDAAAGAVLIFAIGAVVIGIIVLFQPKAFAKMFEYFSTHIPALIAFIGSVIVSILFIFCFGKKKN